MILPVYRGHLLALGVAAVVGALGGCGAVKAHRTKVQPADIARARAFKGFDLYYVGDSFRGLPLTKILQSSSRDPSVTFWYGDCEPVGGEGACSYPISIHVSDICRRHFKMYGLPVTRLTRVRGVPAGQFGNGLELYTGDATIVSTRVTRPSSQAAVRWTSRRSHGGCAPWTDASPPPRLCPLP